jgi:hypothetical protein
MAIPEPVSTLLWLLWDDMAQARGHLAETFGLYLDIGNSNTDVCPGQYFLSLSLHLRTSC